MPFFGTPGERPYWRRGVLTRPIANPIERILHFFNESIWEDDPRYGWVRRFLYPKLRVLTLVYWNYFSHSIARHAAALTYSSLLSLVPILAVAFSLFKVFGGLNGVEERLYGLIFSYLTPTPDLQQQIRGIVDGFVQNIRGSNNQATAFLGPILLFYTVVNTLAWIESSFNEIFGIKKSRSLFARFTVYWAVATLGPVLLGASLALSTAFMSSSFLARLQERVQIVEVLARIAPSLLTCAAFALLYKFLPNTKVKLRAAVIGGLIAGISFELAKVGFTHAAVSLVGGYQRVYGPIALLFVFFFWIWLSWMILLIGLEFVVATQSATTHRREELASQVSQKVREMIALRVVTEVAERFYLGTAPPTVERLASTLEVPLRLVYDVLSVLESRGIVRGVEEEGDEHGFLPARHLAKLSIYDVISAMREDGAAGFVPRADDDARYLSRLVKEAEAANRRAFGEETLERVVERLFEYRDGRRKEREEGVGGKPAEIPAKEGAGSAPEEREEMRVKPAERRAGAE